MKLKHYILAALVPFMWACIEPEPGGGPDDNSGTDDNGIVTEEQMPDPEETRTVSLYKNDSHSISGIFVNDADKITSDNYWDFIDLGEVKGLGNIIAIPKEGWSSTVNAKLGHGYVAYNSNYGFISLFISNQATDEMGTITGYQFKYYDEFMGLDETPTFDQTQIVATAGGGNFSVLQTNETIIPFHAEYDCDWIRVYRKPYVSLTEGSGVEIEVMPTQSLEDAEAIVTLKSHFGKETTITVTRSAMVPMEATTSIKDFKLRYKSADLYTANQIPENTIIRGRVVSNDYAGNIYKQLVIDDGTAAVTIRLNRNQIYQTFPYGADVAIDLGGLYVGNYAGLQQVGGLDYYNGSETVSYASFEAITNYQVIGEPDPSKITPKETSLPILDQAKLDLTDLTLWQSRLVRLKDVEFITPGTPLASYQENNNQVLIDASLLSIVLRTSGYATFYNTKTPKGVGSITAILSYYNGAWQLILNDASGISSFDPSKTFIQEPPEPEKKEGDGSFANPYSVSQVYYLDNPGTTAWVEGVIVGVVGDDYLPHVGETSSSSNILLAETRSEYPMEASWLAVQLPVGTAVREALNLQIHPDLIGQKVHVYGSLLKYFGKPGVKNTSSYSFTD